VLAAEVIRRKRDGHALGEEELRFVVAGIADGSLSDAQVGALSMALFLRGMEREERVTFTEAMTRSGTVLEWDLDRPVLDKHSTGGVGDKVSLMLAPIVAACGGAVPMISGRGLGHTGGTLDKLDSVPGYDTTPDLETLRRVIAEAGCAIVGQTADLAPADRRLYAVRDATGTVESIPLIVASILSKKLAAGLDALVMDVKFGSGAFMARREAADELAAALVEVAAGAGLPTVALLTDMDQVLGTAAGNALEVREAIDYLTGAAREPRLHEVTLALAASLLAQGGLADSEDAGRAAAERALESGAAAERFAAMARALGGPADLLERPSDHLAAAPVQRPVAPERPGVVAGMDARAVGLVITGLGGNRRREDDAIDPSVGLTEVAPVGAEVGPDRPRAIVHAASEDAAEQAAGALRAAVSVAGEAPPPRPVIAGRAG
jgi:thymidine phosphorylase